MVPVEADLLNFLARIEVDDVHLDKGISMIVDPNFSLDSIYHWERNDAVREEVVVQAGQISSSTRYEFQRGLDIQAQSIITFNAAQDLLVFLRENLLMCCMMFHDRSRSVYGGKSRNVIERGIVVQCRRIGACQEALVDGLERTHRYNFAD